MQSVAIHRAAELPEDIRSAVERLLGRPLAADEVVSVVAAASQEVSPIEDAEAIARRLEALLDRRAGKVGDVSDEELDAAIDEAVEHARHNRR